MTQTSNRFFDEIARLMNDAAGVAQGVRREFDTLFRTQAERWLQDLDLVKREEFEAVKDMARLAREENEALKIRLAALEAEPRAGHPGPAGGLGAFGRRTAFLAPRVPSGRLRLIRGNAPSPGRVLVFFIAERSSPRTRGEECRAGSLG